MTREDILQIAEMSKLSLSEEEIQIFMGMFSGVMGQVKELDELDTEAIEPLYFLNVKDKPYREDVEEESLDRAEVLKNAPEEEYGYFKVKKVMD
ncbi:MAG: Asp-tRNA(Asn)/Glu-tRNA(Gln) amidotransferase subunit GatC [Tissierellia bacterium]|nr:Asp-tRNA(Asn)/Glu-tRNA(Gln) amidotransferase subunit GatC [Tissierellia bacterium]